MSKELLLYVGTYTELTSFGKGIVFQGKGEGIHCYAFESETGSWMTRPTSTSQDALGPCLTERARPRPLENLT